MKIRFSMGQFDSRYKFLSNSIALLTSIVPQTVNNNSDKKPILHVVVLLLLVLAHFSLG